MKDDERALVDLAGSRKEFSQSDLDFLKISESRAALIAKRHGLLQVNQGSPFVVQWDDLPEDSDDDTILATEPHAETNEADIQGQSGPSLED